MAQEWTKLGPGPNGAILKIGEDGNYYWHTVEEQNLGRKFLAAALAGNFALLGVVVWAFLR